VRRKGRDGKREKPRTGSEGERVREGGSEAFLGELNKASMNAWQF